MTFFIGVLTSIGMLGVVFYTGYGLAYVPIALIRSNGDEEKPVQSARNTTVVGIASLNTRSFNVSSDLEVDAKIKRNAEHIRFLTSRYALSNSEMSQADRIKLHELQREERRLKNLKEQQETDALKGTSGGSNWFMTIVSGCCSGVWSAIGWVKSTVGVLLALVSLLIINSILITNIDKAINSCQASCGYALNVPNILNPVNYVLVESAKFFPLDYFVYGLLALYMLLCTIAALTHLGVRLICVTYRINRSRTFGHSLVMLTFVLIFIILALNVEFYTMAPQYATFGTQFYVQNVNGTISSLPCTLQKAVITTTNSTTFSDNLCVMTEFSQFSLRLTSTMPAFGVIFYYATWVLVASFILNVIGILTFSSNDNSEHRLLDDKDETDDY